MKIPFFKKKSKVIDDDLVQPVQNALQVKAKIDSDIANELSLMEMSQQRLDTLSKQNDNLALQYTDSPLSKYFNNNDTWTNIMKGWGFNKDPSTLYQFERNRCSIITLDNMYAGEGMMRKIITLLPREATREKLIINHTLAKEIQQYQDDRGFTQAIKKTWELARAYRGGVAVLDIDDGEPLHRPVNLNNIKSIKKITLFFDGFEVWPFNFKKNIVPDLFTILDTGTLQELAANNSRNEFMGSLIHRDRLLIFDGEDAAGRNRELNQGWGESIAEIMNKSVNRYSASHERVINILDEFIFRVFKFDGLDGKVGLNKGNQWSAVLQKLLLIDRAKSLLNTFVLDKKDDIDTKTTNVAGLKDLVTLPERDLVARSGIPATLLLGESPNATIGGNAGTSQQTDWYNKVKTEQTEEYLPNIQKFNLYMTYDKSSGMKLKPGERIDVEFASLAQTTKAEDAKIDLDDARTDEIYILNSVAKPSEVRARLISEGKITELDGEPEVIEPPPTNEIEPNETE